MNFPEYIDRPTPVFAQGDIRASRPESYPPICLDKTHFLISRADFERLPEYSLSRPTGVYDGKVWKAFRGNQWWIACYLEEDPPHPDGLATPYRLALIIEETEPNG